QHKQDDATHVTLRSSPIRAADTTTTSLASSDLPLNPSAADFGPPCWRGDAWVRILGVVLPASWSTTMSMDLFDTVMEGIVRAGREAGRVRFIAEVQTRLVGSRLVRRARRQALANAVLTLYRRNPFLLPSLAPLCRELEDVRP